MRLNKNTIHFFRNEHLANFPLYTEALRFFNHKESMVRVAVRTLTLNVYRTDTPLLLLYIYTTYLFIYVYTTLEADGWCSSTSTITRDGGQRRTPTVPAIQFMLTFDCNSGDVVTYPKVLQ